MTFNKFFAIFALFASMFTVALADTQVSTGASPWAGGVVWSRNQWVFPVAAYEVTGITNMFGTKGLDSTLVTLAGMGTNASYDTSQLSVYGSFSLAFRYKVAKEVSISAGPALSIEAQQKPSLGVFVGLSWNM